HNCPGVTARRPLGDTDVVVVSRGGRMYQQAQLYNSSPGFIRSGRSSLLRHAPSGVVRVSEAARAWGRPTSSASRRLGALRAQAGSAAYGAASIKLTHYRTRRRGLSSLLSLSQEAHAQRNGTRRNRRKVTPQ